MTVIMYMSYQIFEFIIIYMPARGHRIKKQKNPSGIQLRGKSHN